MAKCENVGAVTTGLSRKDYMVVLWARDKEHAIKIAAEKFARQKAIDSGIAC
jgi:1,2-phenylacetyl-CoA epoxidase PaaB subunit